MTIFIGLGANLPSRIGQPKQTLAAALERMPEFGICIEALSSWVSSPAYPPSDQPDFVNGVVRVSTSLSPLELMKALLDIEQEFGRTRQKKWEPRVIDLDLLDYQGCVLSIREDGVGVNLPHPHIAERAFVLIPLRELAPEWRHPETSKSIDELIADLGPLGTIKPLNEM